MAYPKDRFTAIQLTPGSFWDQWRCTARNKTLPSLLKMLEDTGRWEMWNLNKRGGLYDAAGASARFARIESRISLTFSFVQTARLGPSILGE